MAEKGLECIVLAGGLGTRLRDAVPDLPKCMAPVAGKPFLQFVLDNVAACGFTHVILSLGYRHEAIEEWLRFYHTDVRISVVVEDSPLGTGGAIRLALSKAENPDVFVLNGDTWFDVHFGRMMEAHLASGATATVALKPMRDFSRYGSVKTATKGGVPRISGFNEKEYCAEGLINGGVYILKKDALDTFPEKFSLETEFFAPKAKSGGLAASVEDGKFIDIGIPEDYDKAQDLFGGGRYKRYDTLFLDRDGVINRKREGDYVKNVSEFEFLPGVPEAIAKLNKFFVHTVIVTNQRGVGKGLMSQDDLDAVHSHMLAVIEAAGGGIDGIYVCTATDDADTRRKPNIGMAFEVESDCPGLDRSSSLVAGDSPSDAEFARRAGIPFILITPEFTLPDLAKQISAQ